MAVWEQVAHETTIPHVSYAVIGFSLMLFGTVSLFLKEKLYIGEATVATIYGLIVGPHCLDWFSPTTWGDTDYITLEISRVVLIVQIFAVAVELPKKYMLRHWWSVTMLLIPVMSFGWVVSSVFIWKLVPTLRWIDALCIAGCVTATDPVLASAVVGKGKFARRVPTHLRNLLSAESGCNDGMAFPFVIMAVYIERYEHHPAEIAKEFILVGILYSCCLGILVGAIIGYGARHLIKFAEKRNLIDRESFLVFYFCVALFCAGVGTLCGIDDLLVAFAAGSAFSWDGWFSKQTEESHVSDVIDILLNTAFFVYFGAVVPWPDFNNFDLGLKAWKLVCLAIIILVVRRIPIMLAIKPLTPDIHTWRESLFCGHFGPIGVGAIFMCLLARAQMETHSEKPTSELLPYDDPHYFLVACIWPITCFLVIASIIVHGSSVAVFTLGQRINNMAITLTYTTGGNEPSWMSRLPRRSSEGGNILQLQRMETEEPFGFAKKKRRKVKRRPSILRRRRSSSAGGGRTEGRSTETERTEGDQTPRHEDARIPDQAGFTSATPRRSTDSQDSRPGAGGVGKRGRHHRHLGHRHRRSSSEEKHHHHHHRHHHESLPEHIRHELSPEREDDDAASQLELVLSLELSDEGHIQRSDHVAAKRLEGKELSDINAYREGKHIVVEDDDGNFIHKFDIGDSKGDIKGKPQLQIVASEEPPEHKGRQQQTPGPGAVTGERFSTPDEGFDEQEVSMGTTAAGSARKEDVDSSTDTSLDNEKGGGDTAAGAGAARTSQSQQRPRRRSIPRMARTRSTLEIPRSGARAHAYMIDNMVYVENEDGDILRRYKYVPRGKSPDKTSKKSTFMTKVRNFFPRFTSLTSPSSDSNISSGSSETHDDKDFKDVEHAPIPMLVPEEPDQTLSTSATALSVDDERMVRRRLSNMLQAGTIDRHQSHRGSELSGMRLNSRANTVHSQAIETDDDDEGDEYDTQDEEDAEPETAVERHRRLAALGIIPTNDDDNDEESRHTDASTQAITDEEQPKITFMLPEPRRG